MLFIHNVVRKSISPSLTFVLALTCFYEFAQENSIQNIVVLKSWLYLFQPYGIQGKFMD